MKIKGNLQLKYKNSKTAKTVYESLEVDNIGFLESKLKNNTIEYELDNDSLETFLSTADDLIASEIVVEKILEKTIHLFKNSIYISLLNILTI